MKKILLAYCFLCISVHAFAGGFQVNLQGGKQIGMAHAGAGLALDASTLFFNPGALSFVEKNGFQVGINAIIARSSYLEASPGTYTASTLPGVSPPFSVYGSTRLGKSQRFSFGVGVYTPFGSKVAYADDWKGQFMLRELSLRAFFIQPTLSYKVSEEFGIGFGAVLATGSVSLRKGIPAQFPDGSYGEASLKGSGFGYGLNAGVYLKPWEKLSIGISYRSVVGFNAKDGAAAFNVPDDLKDYFPATTFSAKIRLPWTATLGVAYHPIDKLTLCLDANWVGWDVYDTLAFDFAENTDKLVDQASPRRYKKAWIFRLGGQYQVMDKLQIRAGVYFDMTPVQNGYITPETPDANKLGISAGASYRIIDLIEVDASFLWVEGFKRTASNFENNFSGTFKARALIPGLAVNIYLPHKQDKPPENPSDGL